jgi:hypothetical protein
MEAFANNFSLEPSDADYARDWLNSLQVDNSQNDFASST